MTKHRIITDSYCGYEVQVWRWWWPFWTQKGFTNTHSTLEKARRFAREGEVVEYLDNDNTGKE